MQNAIETIMTRRSIRAFTDQPIPRADLETILGAAIHAPSGMNRQTWRFTVVQDKTVLHRLADTLGRVLGREGYNFYCPDVLVLASNDRNNPHGMEDCACALENMFLAAHALGIGSVWINQFKGVCDDEAVRAQLDLLELPPEHVVWGCAALGYAAAPPREANKNADVIHWVC